MKTLILITYQVLRNTQAGPEPFIVTDNVLSLSKRCTYFGSVCAYLEHIQKQRRQFFFMHKDFTIKHLSSQTCTNRQCFGMSSFWRHHPILYQKVATDHQEVPTIHHPQEFQQGAFRSGTTSPLCQVPEFIFKNTLHR